MNSYNNIHPLIKVLFAVLIAFFVLSGVSAVWAITLPVPDINTYYEQLSKSQSTKIYDRTGKVQLYDLSGTFHRTQVPLANISKYVVQGTIAIEDDKFYKHNGIEPASIARALLVDIVSGSKKEGASTITQQVVKNTLLTNEKTWTRKIKEVVLALKLEKTMDKNKILELYLNEIPYGGTLYGVQEAAKSFFNKDAKDLSLSEAAYLAAIPQAPTTYSPYGNHRDLLENRKNLVLSRMAALGYITKDEAIRAMVAKVSFAPPAFRGLNAPHFVFFIKDYLEQKYGGAAQIEKMGLKVYTTLDFPLQQKMEEVVKKYAEENEKNFNAKNAAMVATDPKTGQILAMVGSRDYFDTANEGNFNVALAHRQPGSSFKPFVYATAFNQGYTPDTVLFDLPTEFNPSCPPTASKNKAKECYMPVNYDANYLGPMTLRDALAQSRNIPAVKLLYLTGINNALSTAKSMGINSLKDANTYGLTLVLGGGEVSLLEMTEAYGVFAADGVRHTPTGILKVVDGNGKVLEEYRADPGQQVLPTNSARLISNILSDNQARTPAYGANSPLYFPGRDVAAKTGTSNDFRDTWILGYSPNLAVGAWAGNNDNSPIAKKVAGMVVAPMWGAFMREVLPARPNDKFPLPDPVAAPKPVFRGIWQGGLVSSQNGMDQISTDVHSILYWVDKRDPLGPKPADPNNDGQFNNWEYPIRRWAAQNGYAASGALLSVPSVANSTVPSGQAPVVTIDRPQINEEFAPDADVPVQLTIRSSSPITKTEFYLNRTLIKTATQNITRLLFGLTELDNVSQNNELTVVVYDQSGRKAENTVNFKVGTSTPNQ
jgi:1A family penicillin-binding protein